MLNWSMKWFEIDHLKYFSKPILFVLGHTEIATNIATGEEISFLSGRMAAKELGVSDKNMPGALKGRIKSLGGYKFRYADAEGS